MDKKLTDSEIVKALEWYVSKFKTAGFVYMDAHGTHLIGTQDVLDLINRQKADIKKLTSGKCVYLSDDETTEYCVEGPCPNYKTVAQIKAEAYKECIEKVKSAWVDLPTMSDDEGEYDYVCVEVLQDFCDNLLKEMEGKNNECQNK